jgi:hypothetical protein
MANKITLDTIIYKQFANYKSLEEMSENQWFALNEKYGESYGNIHKKYKFIKEPKLLDIGDGNVREMIENFIKNSDANILIYSNPDEQYSGGKSNKIYHNILHKYFGKNYDGTIINENKLNSSNKYSIQDLAGPSEIVIWKDYSTLLQELTNGGKKRKNTIKNKKNKKNKTRKLHRYIY